VKNPVRIVAALATLVLLAGCTAIAPTPIATSTPVASEASADPALAKFYGQVLSWHSCETKMQCATATAPLDWSKPTGKTISLALIRHVATGTSLGSLFVNPGGPGGSGYDFLASGVTSAVDKTLAKNYDIVSWDPRGVGKSTAISCGSAKTLDHYLFDLGPNDVVDSEVGTDKWFDESDKLTTDFGAECAKGSGDLLAHVSTLDTAKDLDMLRANLGQQKLTYLGYSYGTFIGATYAETFPDKTGKLVLDGAVDPAESYVNVVVTQSKGFENALRAYIAWCLPQKDCPFTGTVDQAIAKVSTLLDTLDKSPIKNDDGRQLGGATMQTAIDEPLYSKNYWSYLNQLFSDVFSGSASIAFALADSYYDRNQNGTYSSNLIVAFLATTCLDYPAKQSRAASRAEAKRVEGEAPLFGKDAGYAAHGCYGWPTDAVRTPAPIAAKGSSDILVLGTTNDPATPYANAVSLAKQLENGHLVSYTGEGHTAYNGDSTCIDETVDAYFVSGTVPATDPQC
jgi:pimeloyl-ACP methyl ester carboxylesterase